MNPKGGHNFCHVTLVPSREPPMGLPPKLVSKNSIASRSRCVKRSSKSWAEAVLAGEEKSCGLVVVSTACRPTGTNGLLASQRRQVEALLSRQVSWLRLSRFRLPANATSLLHVPAPSGLSSFRSFDQHPSSSRRDTCSYGSQWHCEALGGLFISRRLHVVPLL